MKLKFLLTAGGNYDYPCHFGKDVLIYCKFCYLGLDNYPIGVYCTDKTSKVYPACFIHNSISLVNLFWNKL